MTEALLIAVLIVGIANLALVILLIGGRRDAAREIDRLKRDMLDEQRALRAEVSENTRRSINAVGETLLNEYQRDTLNQEQRFKTFALETRSAWSRYAAAWSVSLPTYARITAKSWTKCAA